MFNRFGKKLVLHKDQASLALQMANVSYIIKSLENFYYMLNAHLISIESMLHKECSELNNVICGLSIVKFQIFFKNFIDTTA